MRRAARWHLLLSRWVVQHSMHSSSTRLRHGAAAAPFVGRSGDALPAAAALHQVVRRSKGMRGAEHAQQHTLGMLSFLHMLS